MEGSTIMNFLAAAVVLGLSSAIAPGPLLTLVLVQTLQFGKKEGIKIAISPLITDLPIIIVAALGFSYFTDTTSALAIISFIGALFLLYLAINSFRAVSVGTQSVALSGNSIRKGVLANFLNPGPYLFWGTVGAPYLYKAMAINIWYAVSFLLSFYFMLIGTKIVLVFIVYRTREFISPKLYRIIMCSLGGLLFLFAASLFYEVYSFWFV